MEVQDSHVSGLYISLDFMVELEVFRVIDVYLLIILLTGDDKDALHVRVCSTLCMDIITEVMDPAVTNLIKIFPDACLLILTDTLHDEVFSTVYYD